jgi:hypothetical protein
MPQLFISHAEEDQASAIEIGDALAQRGFSVWLYERDSVPGPPYLMQVSEAIAQCEGVILIISQASMDSHQVDAEVSLAFDSKKRFLPVMSGISYADFKTRRPDWWLALRAATSITLPTDGASAILDHIESGVRRLGVNPSPRPTRDENEARKRDEESSATPPKESRKAYLCYAREDMAEVLRRAEWLTMAGVSVLINIMDTDPYKEPSQSWEESIYRDKCRVIDAADMFYLFWSEAASKSEWVSREIDYALRRQNGDPNNPPEVIGIVLGENAPPPPEKLASLNFHHLPFKTVIPTRCVPILLTLESNGVYVGRASEELFQKAEFYLAVNAEMPAAQLIRCVQMVVKVGSLDVIKVMIVNSLPGLTLTHAIPPPAPIPTRGGYHYFNLEKEGRYWDRINKAKNIAIFVPSDIPEPKLELYAVKS